MVKIAAETQNFAYANNMHQFYEAIKAIHGPVRRNLTSVKSVDGVLLKDQQQILGRWAEHFSSLLNRRNPIDLSFLDTLPAKPRRYEMDAQPTFSEMNCVTKDLKNNKSAGPDGIPAELFKEGSY